MDLTYFCFWSRAKEQSQIKTVSPRVLLFSVSCRIIVKRGKAISISRKSSSQSLLCCNSSGAYDFQADLAEMGAALSAGMELGWVNPIVGSFFDLSDAGTAQEMTLKRPDGYKGKIVLKLV